jgi:CBS domain-containing protein
VHQLYVTDDRQLLGVLGTTELMRAVVRSRSRRPLRELAKPGVVVVAAGDPITLALDRMDEAGVSGLVVTDDGWAIGIFTQVEALAARAAAAGDTVERWMSSSVVFVPFDMPAHRAAAMALETGPRRLLATDAHGVRGIVSGMDFARLVAQTA